MDAQALLCNSLNNEKESKAKYQAKLGNGENFSCALSKLTREKKIKNSPLEVYRLKRSALTKWLRSSLCGVVAFFGPKTGWELTFSGYWHPLQHRNSCTLPANSFLTLKNRKRKCGPNDAHFIVTEQPGLGLILCWWQSSWQADAQWGTAGAVPGKV